MRTMIFHPFIPSSLSLSVPFSRPNVDVPSAALDDDGHVDRGSPGRGALADGGGAAAAAAPAAAPLVVAAEDERVADVAAPASAADFLVHSTSDFVLLILLRDDPSSSHADRRLHNDHTREEGFIHCVAHVANAK